MKVKFEDYFAKVKSEVILVLVTLVEIADICISRMGGSNHQAEAILCLMAAFLWMSAYLKMNIKTYYILSKVANCFAVYHMLRAFIENI